jgi:hypothetical protein
VPDATVKGRKIRARCKCGARVVVQDEERAAKSSASSQTTGSIHRPVRWFVDITSWEPIAMDLRQLIKAFDAGRIDADTLVWRKGMPDWSRLRDVSELAERLLGSEAAARVTVPGEPSVEGHAGASAPPAHERSRTPPASYAVPSADGAFVGQLRSGTTPFGEPPRPVSPAAVSSVSPPAVASPAVAFLPMETPAAPSAVSAAGQPSNEAFATAGESSRPSARANRRRSSRSQPAHARPSGPPRVLASVTQTGLESPASVAKRTSVAPGAAPAREDAAAGRGSASSAAPSSRGRDTRSSTAGSSTAPRRPPSNDETPAQKPSSVSVLPGPLGATPAPSHGRRWLAFAALVVGGGLWLGLSSHDAPAPMTQVADVEVAPAEQPAPPPTAERGQSAPPRGVPTEAEVEAPSPVTAPAGIRVPPAETRQPRSVVLPPAPRPVVEAKRAQDVAPVQRRRAAPLAVPAVPRPAEPVVQTAPQPSSSPPSPAVQSPAATPAGLPNAGLPNTAGQVAAISTPDPSVPAPPVVNPTPPVPAPPAEFDAESAEQQLGIATWKASTCGPMGSTRGAGQVSVLIESWGRVVRVTHLNQSFVGTPVGLCVMQAFQQVRVSPFQGGARTVTGSFVVE